MANDFEASLVFRFVDRISAPLRRVTKNFRAVRQASEHAAKAFKTAGDMRQAAEGVNTFARASRALVTGPVQASEDFGHAIARAGGLANVAGEQLAVLEAEALRLGSTIGEFSAKQAADGMAEFGIAGFKVSETMEALPTVLDLSSAAGMGLADTIGVTTGVMGAFNLGAEETRSVSDILTATFTGSKTTLQSLGETMSYAGANMAGLGVDIKQVAVMAGLLGNASIEGSRAGTAMNAIMSRLVAPRRMSKSILNQLKIQMTELVDGVPKMRAPMDLLAEIAEKTEGMRVDKKKGLLFRLFGLEAGPAVSVLMAKVGSKKIKELTEAVEQSSGRTTKLATTMRATAKGATMELTSAIDTFKIVAGKALDDVLLPLKRFLIFIIGGFTKWAQAHPRLTKVLMVTVAGVAALTTAMAGFMFFLATLTSAKGLLFLATGYKTVGVAIMKWALPAVVKLSVAMFANPIGLVIAAVTALAIAAYLLYDNWEFVSSWFLQTWERFKNVSIGAKVAIIALLSPLLAMLAPFIAIGLAAKTIYDNWEPIKTFFIELWDEFVAGAKKALEVIGFLADPLDIIGKLSGTGVGDALKGVFGSAAGAVADVGREVAWVAGAGAGTAAMQQSDALMSRTGGGVGGEAKVKIEFDDSGMTRVKKENVADGLDIDIDTGWSMVYES